MSRYFVYGLSILTVLSFSIPGLTADVAVGKTKYSMLCQSCHGAGGAGDGVASAALNPKPKDLRHTTKTDGELAKIIKEGGAKNGLSPLMPAWGTVLSDAEVASVVAYVRTLAKK